MLAEDGLSFDGQWRPKGSEAWDRWSGHRPAVPSQNFSGVWKTSYGMMRLTQKGNEVEGCYAYRGQATISGTVKEDALALTYHLSRTERRDRRNSSCRRIGRALTASGGPMRARSTVRGPGRVWSRSRAGCGWSFWRPAGEASLREPECSLETCCGSSSRGCRRWRCVTGISRACGFREVVRGTALYQ